MSSFKHTRHAVFSTHWAGVGKNKHTRIGCGTCLREITPANGISNWSRSSASGGSLLLA